VQALPFPGPEFMASGSLRKSKTERSLNSQKIYHCRKYLLGHFAIIYRSFVTMEKGKGRTDLKFPMVQGLPNPPLFETQEIP